MTAWIKIALRNLIKNRRRSLFTMLAIMLGFAAVNLFGGFTTYMYQANREGSIYSAFQGHLSIVRKGFFENDRTDPLRLLLTSQEMSEIRDACQKISDIVLVTPQLRLNGLITDGKVSTIFMAQGYVPSSQDAFMKGTHLKLMEPFVGKRLEDEAENGIGISRGLARSLKLKIGSEAVVMATTAEGQMNALDAEIYQLFDAPSAAINDRFIRVPFRFAQQLYDTDGAHVMSVLLDKTVQTESVRNRLQKIFEQKQMDIEIKTWNELSEWYTKVKNMFDVIFLFLFLIVFIIVTMSVINTMSMAVLERTREIGTLRSLGLKRRGVLSLFAIESFLIGVGGIIGGGVVSFVAWLGIYYYKPLWAPPGITVKIPLRIIFTVEFFFYSIGFLLILCLVASLIPARRAANQNVVDALGHV
jgi:putative ABC transport system permease protein